MKHFMKSSLCFVFFLFIKGKKDVAQVFNNILRRQIGTRSPTVEYICTKPEIIFTLMSGYVCLFNINIKQQLMNILYIIYNTGGILFYSYEHQDVALNCGTMLRECARYEALAKIMIYSDDFYNFFRYVEVSTFDIASDAFSTFKVRYDIKRRIKIYPNIICMTFLIRCYMKLNNSCLSAHRNYLQGTRYSVLNFQKLITIKFSRTIKGYSIRKIM